MNELRAIVEASEQAARENERTVLATVVRTSGSVYRRPGARLLVRFNASGECSITGAISGGCLERDVCERAKAVLPRGVPVVVSYDTSSGDDIVWGLGLGCNGVVEVLLEPLAPRNALARDANTSADATHPISFLSQHLRRNVRGVMATVFSVEGATKARVGGRLLLDNNGATAATDIEDRELLQRLTSDARTALACGRSPVNEYELSAGHVAVFVEVIEPPVPLVIYGAGADAVPVARLAHEVGWQVTIVDTRAAYNTPERFPTADARIVCRPEDAGGRVALDERTIAVLMTHNYEHDKAHLAILLASPARYVGCLGPRKRTGRMLSELSAEGFELTDKQLARVYTPVGLDIGAETPEEIALSIIAEIRAALSGRAGGSLREYRGAIHGDARGERATSAREDRAGELETIEHEAVTAPNEASYSSARTALALTGRVEASETGDDKPLGSGMGL